MIGQREGFDWRLAGKRLARQRCEDGIGCWVCDAHLTPAKRKRVHIGE
jgi:hypothetical protein